MPSTDSFSQLLDYTLPPELIAQEPLAKRDESRLMVLDRQKKSIEHRHFYDLPELLQPEDLIVRNISKVLPARLVGTRATTGGRWEGLFLAEEKPNLWRMLTRTKGKPLPDETIMIVPQEFELVLREKGDGYWLVEPIPRGSPFVLLEKYGQIPLPPYIRKGQANEADRHRYQTVYAQTQGSVAAPTAGLHFTPELIQKLEQSRITFADVTLHVGQGTFESMRSADPHEHQMHSEFGQLPAETVQAILKTKAKAKRVVAVGTTSTRTLESAARIQPLQPWEGETDLFIYPPYSFQVVNALITNFHLPQTTLLLLVAAFADPQFIREAYQEAIRQRYRFFSYGDAMLIL